MDLSVEEVIIVNNYNNIVLMDVCLNGCLGEVKKWIKVKIDVNMGDGKKNLLMVVCFNEYISVVYELIKVGVNVNLWIVCKI